MAIAKELGTRGSKQPILLKGTGQSLYLEVKVGSLGVELWHFPNEEAQPYVRLIFEPGQGGKTDDLLEQEKTEWSVTIDWQEACTLSGAIQEWLSYLESNIEEYREPALHMGLESLTVDFYKQGSGQGPRMICTVDAEGGLSRQVILTRSEASLLGRLIFCQGDDEAEQRG